MSKIVGQRWVVFQGNEVKRNVTCCEDAKWKVEQLFQLDEYIRKINTIINPRSNGYINIVYENTGKFKLNYCPVCGNKYEEEK